MFFIRSGDDDRIKRLRSLGNILNIYVCMCLLYEYVIYVRCLTEVEAFVFVGASPVNLTGPWAGLRLSPERRISGIVPFRHSRPDFHGGKLQSESSGIG